MSQRSPGGRLLLLLLPLAVAAGFTAWWLTGDAPQLPKTSFEMPQVRMPDLAPVWKRIVELGRAMGIDKDEVTTVASVRPSFTLDLESGTVGGSPAADLWWHFVTRDERYLDGRSGALLALIDDLSFEQADESFLKRIRYVQTSLRASGTNPPVRPGAVIAVRTMEGNHAKVRVLEAASGAAELKLEWLVYVSPQGKQPVANAAIGWEGKMQEALAAYRAKRPDDAERLHAEALAGAETFGTDNPRVALVLQRMGSMYWSMRRFEESERRLVRAAAILEGVKQSDLVEQLGLPNVFLVADVHRMLGVVYREQEKHEAASKHFLSASQAAQSLKLGASLDMRGMAIASNALDHAMAECQLGRNDEARKALQLARQSSPAQKSTQWIVERVDRLDRNIAAGAACGR